MKTNTFFHVTTDETLSVILNEGLKPKLGERSKEYGELKPCIFLFNSEDDKDTALLQWMGEWFEDDDTELHSLQIELPVHIQITQTCEWESVCYEAILPEYITYVKSEG